MPCISIKRNYAKKRLGCSKLLLANNFLFVMMLACPMIHGAVRYFADSYICEFIISVFAFLNYLLYKNSGGVAAVENGPTTENSGRKFKARAVAWSALISAVMLIGIGPLLDPSDYAVDKFTRIIGRGDFNGYLITKKVHYFYLAVIIYSLLLFNVYRNIVLGLINNQNNKIRRTCKFSDTFLFVGYSFLIVCVYRQYSNQFSSDCTIYLFKSVLIFCIPAFYIW